MIVADFGFPAVELPAETHQVDFSFQPRLFKIGAMVSILSLGSILLVFCETRESGKARPYESLNKFDPAIQDVVARSRQPAFFWSHEECEVDRTCPAG